jgi:hypothetical protein
VQAPPEGVRHLRPGTPGSSFHRRRRAHGDTKGITMFNNTIRKNVIASFCFFALLFAAAVGVDAQTDSPIEEDDIVASVSVGDEFWTAPVALKQALEVATGQVAIVETMTQLLNRLPAATPSNGLRIEGGYASPVVKFKLENLGYDSLMNLEQPAVVGATIAVRHSL